MFETMSAHRQCRLTMAQEKIDIRPYYFMAAPKRSPLVVELNEA